MKTLTPNHFDDAHTHTYRTHSEVISIALCRQWFVHSSSQSSRAAAASNGNAKWKWGLRLLFSVICITHIVFSHLNKETNKNCTHRVPLFLKRNIFSRSGSVCSLFFFHFSFNARRTKFYFEMMNCVKSKLNHIIIPKKIKTNRKEKEREAFTAASTSYAPIKFVRQKRRNCVCMEWWRATFQNRGDRIQFTRVRSVRCSVRLIKLLLLLLHPLLFYAPMRLQQNKKKCNALIRREY